MTKLNESQILARIRQLFPGGEGLTDDCGCVPEPPPGHRLLVTTDLMEEGQHFRMEWHPPELLGRKLLMVNLSDLDASGAVPLGFTLTLALGRELDPRWLEAFLCGLAAAAREQSVPVIGGDTVGRASGLGLGITAFGAAGQWLKRDGAIEGDRLYVDQPLGASLRGLRKLQSGLRWNPSVVDPEISAHLNPRPNLGLGVRLAAMAGVHACIDLSDGLSKDLRMLAQASDLSVILEPGLEQEEIEGGEDYARCFASSLPQAELEQRLGLPLHPVGTVVPKGESPLLIYDGDIPRAFPDQSYDHFECP